MVYSKRIAIFAVEKKKNDKKIGWISASFPLSASHSLLSVKFLLKRSNYTKRIGKSKIHFFLSMLASIAGRWV